MQINSYEDVPLRRSSRRVKARIVEIPIISPSRKYPLSQRRYQCPLPEVSEAMASIFKQVLADIEVDSNEVLSRKFIDDNFESVRRDFDRGILRLLWSKAIGWGVFTGNESIPANYMIGVYSGKVVLKSEDSSEKSRFDFNIHGRVGVSELEFERLKTEDTLTTKNTEYSDEDYDIVVDANIKGNWTRFLNHSDSPNCKFEYRLIGVSRESTIVLPVISTIKAVAQNTQLTINYGANYWNPQNRKKIFVRKDEFHLL